MRAEVNKALTVDDAWVQRRGKDVLKGAWAHVQKGALNVMMGPNGSGKSTLFKALIGVVAAQRMRVCLDGVALAPGSTALRRQLGVAFQEPSLDVRLGAAANLRLGAKLYGLDTTTTERRVNEALDFMALNTRAREPVQRLSGGMRRRLELARAIVHRPKVVLLDEPTQGLDPIAKARLWQLLHDMRQSLGMAVFICSHDPEEAMQADCVSILIDGKVAACDTPTHLLAKVQGDVITLETQAPDVVARAVEENFSTLTETTSTSIIFRHAEAPRLVPKIMALKESHLITSLNIRRPSLVDVLHLCVEPKITAPTVSSTHDQNL